MKNIITYVVTTVLCLSASIAFGEQNAQMYGIGIQEDASGYAAIPTDFVFDYNNYPKIISKYGGVSAKRTYDNYCLDMMPVRANGVSVNDKTPAGTLFVTSDAHLQNAAFYTFDAAGLAEWNQLTFNNWTEDTRDYILSDNASISRSEYRVKFPNGEGYYVGIRSSAVGAYQKSYHDGIHYGNVVATKPMNMNYLRPDATSPTGYQKQNYELISYHVNKPVASLNSHVLARPSLNASVGGEVISITPKLLGCYEVQPTGEDINYGGPVDFFRHVEFLWLVQYNYKTAYPVMEVRNSTEAAEQRSVFDSNAYYTNYEWITTIKP